MDNTVVRFDWDVGLANGVRVIICYVFHVSCLFALQPLGRRVGDIAQHGGTCLTVSLVPFELIHA